MLLTYQGGGPERNPDAARLGQALGNVTFLERPFHPTTLVSIVGSAIRGRRRQYETRAILADLTASEICCRRRSTRPSRRAGAASAGLRAGSFRHLHRLFWTEAGRAVYLQDLLAAVHPDDRVRRLAVLDQAIATGGDYSIEYRNVWPDGSQHWVDVRARAVRRPDGSIRSLVGVSPTSPPARRPKSSRDICSPTGGRTHRAGRIDRDPRQPSSSERPIRSRLDGSREGAGRCARPRRWRPSASLLAVSRTISTIC